MNIIVGNLKSEIVTDNTKLLNALVEHFSFSIPGARYYKRYYGDGKKYFVTKAGYFRTGLLPNVLAALDKVGIKPNITYKKVDIPSFDKELINELQVTLYDYQREAVDHALTSKRCLIKSPTGSGKTVIMAGLLAALQDLRTVVLFTSKQLLNQTYKFLKSQGFTNVGVNSGDGFQDGEIMLSTVQSIDKIIDEYVAKAQVLIVDEVHEFCKGKTTLAAIEAFPKAVYRYGFTATLPKEKIYLYNLVGAFGQPYVVKSTADLIEEDKLTKPHIMCVGVDYSTNDELMSESMQYRDIYSMFVIHDKFKHNLIKELVTKIHSKTKSPKILILVKNLEHMKAIASIVPNSVTIEGDDDIETRYQKINKFIKGEYSTIIGTKVMQTGVDIKEITHFINATELKSEIATIQGLGRALRKDSSKEIVYVFDIGSNNIKYLSDHKKKRETSYKREGHEYDHFTTRTSDR